MGLGGYPLVSLIEAREKAFVNRKLARDGDDPRVAKRRGAMPSFAEAAEQVIALRGPDWRHRKTAKRWAATLSTYAYPFFGGLPISRVSGADVLRALTPIWTEKAETARQVRGHIRDIFDWAIGQGYRSDNPAGDPLRLALKRRRRAKAHFRALHYAAVPAALDAVHRSNAATASKLSFQFMVLTAARPGEMRNVEWGDIDLNTRTWTIPAHRMKAEREHRVPLSGRAVEILRAAAVLDAGGGLVFPSPVTGGPLSNNTHRQMLADLRIAAVPHGFRSSFRDWAAERTDASHAVMEASLAHVVANSTEAAYFRSDLFEKRRTLMDQWAEYLLPPGA